MQMLISYFRWLMMAVILLLFFVVFFPVVAVISHRKLNPLLRSFSWAMLWASGMREAVKGLDHIRTGQKYLIVFNHTNIFDQFLLYGYLPLTIRAVEKESHFHWPLYGWFLKRIEQVPIAPQGNTRSAIQSLEKAKQLYDSGISIAVAPEGTRSPSGELLPFKKGAFHLAVQLQAEILPVVLKGMYRLHHKNTWRIQPGPVELKVLAPISTVGKTKEDVASLTQDLESLIRRELNAAIE